MLIEPGSEPGTEHPVALHNRLDVWTSGLVVFGLSTQANKVLAALFANRRVTKEYTAICVGRPSENHGELFHYLAKKRIDGIDMMVPVRSGGKHARASFVVEAHDEARELSLVSFTLETGRMHQLRVQAAESGWPILGDDLYGDPEANACAHRQHKFKGQLLHAERAAFDDPIEGIQINVTAPRPGEFGHYFETSG